MSGNKGSFKNTNQGWFRISPRSRIRRLGARAIELFRKGVDLAIEKKAKP